MICNHKSVDELYIKLSNTASDRATIYQLLSKVINRPTFELAELLINGEFYKKVSSSVEWVNASSSIFDIPLEKLKRVCTNLTELKVDELLIQMKTEYTRLFLDEGRTTVPIFELEFIDYLTDKAATQEAIEKTYHEQNFHPKHDLHERSDLIGMEMGYLNHLCLIESEAWKNGKIETAKQWKMKQRNFIENHLGKWGEYFFKNIVNTSCLDIYVALGMLGTNFMRLEKGNY